MKIHLIILNWHIQLFKRVNNYLLIYFKYIRDIYEKNNKLL
jgi:hypothetical protein